VNCSGWQGRSDFAREAKPQTGMRSAVFKMRHWFRRRKVRNRAAPPLRQGGDPKSRSRTPNGAFISYQHPGGWTIARAGVV